MLVESIRRNAEIKIMRFLHSIPSFLSRFLRKMQMLLVYLPEMRTMKIWGASSSPVSGLKIQESEKDLERLFNQQTQPMLKDKVGALYLLKLGKVQTCLELANVIGWDATTLETWLQIYRTQGIAALLQSRDELTVS
jgi:hypothetical protein